MKNIFYLSLWVLTSACAQTPVKTNINEEFKSYWYNGTAEITSYHLEQARYGEVTKGHAVNIFVTEPFSKKYNTKADNANEENISVLKLNATKKFNTGIYPYSIMTSTFLPVEVPKASLKISSSTQEWCGHEYTELKNEVDKFIVDNASYFQDSSFKNKEFNHDVLLEDDIWSKIRLIPYHLPQGNLKALPSFVYLRMSHNEVKTYKAVVELINKDTLNVYKITYPDLDRTLSITFENVFPYKILGWTETYYSGWGANKKLLTTKAALNKTLNIPYWQKNKNKDLYLRKELGIE